MNCFLLLTTTLKYCLSYLHFKLSNFENCRETAFIGSYGVLTIIHSSFFLKNLYRYILFCIILLHTQHQLFSSVDFFLNQLLKEGYALCGILDSAGVLRVNGKKASHAGDGDFLCSIQGLGSDLTGTNNSSPWYCWSSLTPLVSCRT